MRTSSKGNKHDEKSKRSLENDKNWNNDDDVVDDDNDYEKRAK